MLAADLGDGTDDPRATAPDLLRRALAALSAAARAPGRVAMRADAGYFAGQLARAAHDAQISFAIGAKRIAPLWRLLAGIAEDDWHDAIDMDNAQVAVAEYCPDWWPASTRLLIRQVLLDPAQVSADPRSRRRRRSRYEIPARCTAPRTSGPPAREPGPASTAGPPIQRPGIKHHLQLSQLRPIQLAARGLPPGGQPGQAASLPGPAPLPHRPLADPQLSGDHGCWRTLLESLDGLQPDLLPASPALAGQPATLRIPHTSCIPPEAARVSPRTSLINPVFSSTSGGGGARLT